MAPFVLSEGCGLGTAPLGSGPGWELDWGPTDRSEAEETVRAAAAAGVGFVDTAAWYGWGRAEEIVGSALAGAERRPPILTKCGDVKDAAGGTVDDHREETILGDVEGSLRRLRVPALDVLQLHDADPRTPIEVSWGTVCRLVEEGKVHAGGLSNHPVELMDRALAVGPVAVVQHEYSLLHRDPESDGVLEWCAAHGVPFLAWSPLGSGFLADGFELDALGAGDLRRRLPWADPARLDHRRLRHELAAIGRETGRSMAALAVGWVLAQGARPIVGARSPAEAAAIATFEAVTPEVTAVLEEAVVDCLR